MAWYSRGLIHELAVKIWLNILSDEYGVTPDRIKVSGLTVYYFNDKEI
jgi:hypothetical protein